MYIERSGDTCRLLTPLHAAAEKFHFDLMDVLLKHGAKVSVSFRPTPRIGEVGL